MKVFVDGTGIYTANLNHQLNARKTVNGLFLGKPKKRPHGSKRSINVGLLTPPEPGGE